MAVKFDGKKTGLFEKERPGKIKFDLPFIIGKI